MRWRRRRRGPVYVVTGFMRSGTTMMMQALEAGGMRVSRAPRGDPSHEFYELPAAARRRVWAEDHETGEPIPEDERFPSPFRGRLIKFPTGTAKYLRPQPEGMLAVFMRRDIEAIRASYRTLDPHGLTVNRRMAERSIERELIYWGNREDSQVLEIWYDDVLRDPEGAMEQVRDFGFPIRKLTKAVDVIDIDRVHPTLATVPA